MSLCILGGAKPLVLAISVFTLSWEHSVERTAWSETWQVGADALALTEARVKGSGAGMDPGPGARLADGWWTWMPSVRPVPRLTLAASGATAGGSLHSDSSLGGVGATCGNGFAAELQPATASPRSATFQLMAAPPDPRPARRLSSDVARR